MHENYVNSLQADIDKLKATLSTTTDPDKKSWCEDYIKALEEEKQECKYETCALCGGKRKEMKHEFKKYNFINYWGRYDDMGDVGNNAEYY